MANEQQPEAPEALGPRTAADMNRVPGQFEYDARKRKAAELAGFFQRRGLSFETLQNMHPMILQHHYRSAGLKGAPSQETMVELRKAMGAKRL